MHWIWIWVAVMAISLIIEFNTFEMVSLWTAIGGLVALILAACGLGLEIQLIVFFAVSIILLLSLRKIALKYLLKSTNNKIGTDSLIGTKHTLISEIKEDQLGTIKINGVVWNVKNINETEEIPAGTKVEIIQIDGNKFIVKK